MVLAERLHDLIGSEGAVITWWQMSIRAIVIFLFGLVLVRFAGKRLFGQWGAMDIVLSVIIGSNLSRILTGGAPFLPTLAATALLVALYAVLSHAAVRFPRLGPILKGHSALLVSDGKPDARALARQGVGEQDLAQALRCAGIEDIRDVRSAYLERSGQISVLKRSDA